MKECSHLVEYIIKCRFKMACFAFLLSFATFGELHKAQEPCQFDLVPLPLPANQLPPELSSDEEEATNVYPCASKGCI